jgi:hypothetical protein
VKLVPGFGFAERMSGSWWRLDAPADELAIAFRVRARVGDLREFARRKTWRLEGSIDVEGLASGKPCEGTLAFRLLDEKRLPYRVRFTGDDGRRYELSGQKEWNGLAPLESMTLLPASLYDERDEEIGRATLRFDLRTDLAGWLRSWRLTFRDRADEVR